MSKPINVYWAPNFGVSGVIERDWTILYEEPENLFISLSKEKNKSNPKNNFLRCPAVSDLTSKVFVVKSPLSTSVKLKIEGDMLSNEVEMDNPSQPNWFIARGPSLNGNVLLHSNYSFLLFSDEDIELTVTAPYFSKAPHMQQGATAPGKMNIGSWFRPVNLEFNLWSGVTELSLGKGEPMAYFNFDTDRRIVMKQFFMNDRLTELAKTNAHSTAWEPSVPLIERYKRFRATKMKDIILSEIKNNLV